MADRDVRERDILVAPNECAYVQDLTKGDIVLYVGPTKISLSNTERMTLFCDGRFVPVRGDEAGLGVSPFVRASSGQYVILSNPRVDMETPPAKGANSGVPLQHGRRIVVPGPVQFPLWPGQTADVVDGHELGADEYLVVRVYERESDESPPIGTETVVRGTDVSFYVPRTGLEVICEGGRYVRRAIRLRKSQGLHLRALTDFEITVDDLLEAGKYRAGQEFFVRDREGHFFPVSNIEVIALVDSVPLAENEGVYVRRYDSGEISVVEGPKNYLPDPTSEEVVERAIDEAAKQLYGIPGYGGKRAVSVYVPPSTVVMVVGKNRREVVVGPQTRILHFNEELERLQLSTGRPKSDEDLLTTCFLRIDGNKVSDSVRVKTLDHVEMDILVSYRVSFTGESERWFAVEDYVGLLCDHLGSLIRSASRAASIEEFHRTSTEILRTAILGPRTEGGEREGRRFSENGMWVYDVEILDAQILDCDVDELLSEAQRAAIDSDIVRKKEQLRLGDERLREQVNREIYEAQMATLSRAREFEEVNRALQIAQVESKNEAEGLALVGKATSEAEALRVAQSAESEVAEKRAALASELMAAQSAAFCEQMQALAPELIATLKTLGNQAVARDLSRHLSPLAILGGESVADVAGRLLDRLPLGPSAGGADLHETIESLLPSSDTIKPNDGE